MQPLTRTALFRLLGDEDRLQLLAMCAQDELTVGELAALLDESQPQVTKKTQPLREAGLLTARRDGTRTLLSMAQALPETDRVIVDAALVEGRSLCARAGRLARVAQLIAEREALSRDYFAQPSAAATEPVNSTQAFAYLAMLAPLLPQRALAVDIGAGDGVLLPVLAPLFDRVIAVDRSAPRLARCAARLTELGLANVRLRQADVDDSGLLQDIQAWGGADVVVLLRVLHHAARPDDIVHAAAKLLRRAGHLIIVDYVAHDDERMRERGDVWLGFTPQRLTHALHQAQLTVRAETVLSASFSDERGTLLPPHQVVIGQRAA